MARWLHTALAAVALALSPARAGAQVLPAPMAPAVALPDTTDGEHACDAEAPVVLRARSAADAQSACEGLRRAQTFLKAAGLRLPALTRVEVVDRLPPDLDGQAVGCYLRDSRRILLLSYEAFAAGGQWFRLPVERELYRAAAAHEAAHAMAAFNAEPRRLPLAAHEYLAYVTMFATLDPALRTRLLARFPGAGLRGSLQINLVVYLTDPLQFAADAWRHHQRQSDPAGWLRDLVAGLVVPEWPDDAP